MLDGRTAFVTGATGAIGAAIVRVLVARGAKVAFSFHHQEDRARDLERELHSTRVRPYFLEVLDQAGCIKVAEQAEQDLGPIDILVNNAGITEHPRWKEMVSERDALKTQLEEHKPLIEAQKAVVDYCTEHGITQDQYGQSLDFLRALNTGDISRAREIMGPIWQVLEGKVDGKLPEDLEKRLAAGTLDMESAQEIARLRTAQSTKQRFAQENAARQSAMAVNRAVQEWVTAKGKLNVAYKPKANGEPDGFYELVNAKAVQLGQSRPVKTSADVVGLLEEAYREVKQSLSRFVTKPAVAGKQLPTAGASRAVKPTYKSSEDVAMAVIRGDYKVRE